ncbi:MAG TPA: proprotein convertase P-domain-containing protein [Myxococcota bacterium]|jgi:subtilisin-like proprotein convertase family protein|nr:proprotein convertase P-domain-containing protein [Myxococcota bacterium]
MTRARPLAAAVGVAGVLAALVGWGLARAAGTAADATAAADEAVVPVVELAHTVEMRVADGAVTCVVRRTVRNAGTVAGDVSLLLALPHGAAVTAFRVFARGRWWKTHLLEADRARDLYQELAGAPPFPPGPPALLEAAGPDLALARWYPVPSGGTSAIEYELTVPAGYEGGHWVASYPRAGGGSGGGGGGGGGGATAPAPVVRVVPGAATTGAGVWIDGHPAAPGEPVALSRDRAPAWSAFPDTGALAGLLEVPFTVHAGGEAVSATVGLEVAHPYRGDLHVTLEPPPAGPGADASTPLLVRAADALPGDGLKGSFALTLPKGTPANGVWRLAVWDVDPGEAGTVVDATLRLKVRAPKAGASSDVAAEPWDGGPLVVPDAPRADREDAARYDGGDEARIDVAAALPGALRARLGVAGVGAGAAWVRLELGAAAALAPMPKRPSVVFLLDASYSVGTAGIEAQLHAARALLRVAPSATRFEIIAFRRKAEALGGADTPAKMRPAADFDAVVAAARAAGKLAPGNGSALDEAYARAARLLAGVKEGYAVALTDALVRSSLAHDALEKALAPAPRDAVIQVVVTQAGGAPALDRADGHPLEPSRPGLVWQLSGASSPNEKALGAALLALLVPTSVDHVEVSLKLASDAESAPASLAAGDGWSALVRLAAPPASVSVKSRLWRRSSAMLVPARPADSRLAAIAALALAPPDPELLALARRAGAASALTSFVSTEPGTRPLWLTGIGMVGDGGSYDRGLPGFGTGHGGGPPLLPDLAGMLRAGADACVAASKPAPAAGWRVHLEIETTFDEVVDVAAVESTAPKPLTQCLAEAAWALRLSRKAFPLERYTYDVTLP